MISRVLALFSVSAILIAGLTLAPAVESKISFDSVSGSYSVKPADLKLVCPGALYATGGTSGTSLGEISRTGSATLELTAAGSGELELMRVESGQASIIALGSNRIFESRSIGDALSITNVNAADQSPQGSLVLTGSTSQIAATGPMRGLAAASCQQPSNDFYLVGGSTMAGREALLVLTNPAPIDATADLRIFTDLGEVKVSGLAGISVPAGSTTTVPIASFAPTVPTFALQVQSQGAKLAGWIQQRAVRGTAAQGVDWISPNPAPSSNPVIPGLVIRGTKAINQVIKAEEKSDAGHALRVFAPEGANLTVQIVSSEEDVFGAVFTGIVAPGTVQDFPIAELLDGDYTVFVSSDKPIYSGVRVARGNPGGTPKVDFAWLSPAEELTSDRALTVFEQGQTLLVLSNAGLENKNVDIRNLVSGDTTSVEVPALGTSSILLSAAVSVAAAEKIFSTAVVLVEGQISDLDLRDPRNIGSKVKVRFR